MRKKIFKAIVLPVAVLGVYAGIAAASSLENVQFLKIAPKDAKAVIKGADGKLQVIKPADVVAEGLTVKQILPGRIVLEESSEKGLQTLIVRLSNDKATIERLSKAPETEPLLLTPGKTRSPFP